MKKILLLAASFAVAEVGYSQGFQLNLQGTKQIAMGQHIAGAALDPSILFYNPGGMGFTKTGISGAFSPVMLKVKALDESTNTVEENKAKFETPFSGYATFAPNKESKLNFGIGVYTPFGSAVNWGDNWSGKALIQDIKLKAISVQPTVSYKITDKLGIGVGFVYTYGSVNLNRALDYTGADGSSSKVNLNGSGSGYSFNAGVYYKASDMLSIGVSYRSQIKIKVTDGDATFTVPASVGTAVPATNKFTSSLPLPQVFNVGLGIRPNEKLLVTLDVNWVGWSAYKQLEFDYDKNQDNTPGVLVPNTVALRNYKDILAYRVGAQYLVSQKFALRGGVAYGSSPIANGYVNPDVPDANRVNLSCGFGYQVGDHFSIDGAFLFENLAKRMGTYDADNFTRTYKGVAYIPSIQLNYQF